jgi:hypothetical protein
MVLPPYLSSDAAGCILAIKVQPRARATAIAGLHGTELKIRVAAPPVDGAANEALIEFLAKCLECGRRQLELARGETSQHKLVRVNGMDRANVAARLLRSGAPGFP